MSAQSNILVVSRDQMLLQARRLILGTYFQVESAARMSEAGSILSKHDFDLIVLCDTLSDAECLQIADMVRNQKPRPTLLSMMGPGSRRTDEFAGRRVMKGTGPLQLLKECAEVLGIDLRSRQRMFPA